MKARPILFNGDMVRAILDGRKTQTRRPMKVQPPSGYGFPGKITNRNELTFGFAGDAPDLFSVKTPHGQPGDLLYVRETFYSGPNKIAYAADNVELPSTARVPGFGPKKPSIHMPRWASRLTLRITDIRVERVQDIDDKGCLQEGIKFELGGVKDYMNNGFPFCGEYGYRNSFKSLWNSIYANWESNPWVWATEFEVIHKNVDEVLAL